MITGQAWKKHWFEVLVCVLVVGVVAVIVLRSINLGRERIRMAEECEERGGHVVEVHGTRDNGWFCQESR